MINMDMCKITYPLSEVAGSNPASPISRYSGETVLSEEVPEE
jgi:hypothetical protein